MWWIYIFTALPLCTAQCFPKDFMIGTATAAYQVEGGYKDFHREPSIWDVFCREKVDLQCANVADDMIHRYPQDFELMSNMGLDSFRFSVSWSRIMNWNNDTKQMVPNPLGIQHYHQFLNELEKHKIEPLLTMYHWDLPNALQQNLNPPGWLNRNITVHFEQYATLLYQEFGQRIKFWATFNEPLSFTTGGYGTGDMAPGFANSTTNVYMAGHTLLLSHALAVQKFRQFKNEGIVRKDARISIVLNCDYGYPLHESNEQDIAAAKRFLEFNIGWFINPIVNGDYPQTMKQYAGDHLPKFSKEESDLLKGTYDLFMLNHYSSKLVTDCNSTESLQSCDALMPGWNADMAAEYSRFPKGAKRGGTSNGKYNCKWFNSYSPGYYDTIKLVHSMNTTTDILLTENGFCGNTTINNKDQLLYYQTYLQEVIRAVEEGIPVIGYTAWSFVDNYEWGSFEPRFGLFYVNFTKNTGSKQGYIPRDNELQRVPRPAAHFIAHVAKTKCLDGFQVDKPASFLSTNGFLCLVLGILLAIAAIRSYRKRNAHQYVQLE